MDLLNILFEVSIFKNVCTTYLVQPMDQFTCAAPLLSTLQKLTQRLCRLNQVETLILVRRGPGWNNTYDIRNSISHFYNCGHQRDRKRPWPHQAT